VIELRNDYGFPLLSAEAVRILWNQQPMPPAPTKLERAQAIAAEVRERRGMVVRKGYYIDLKGILDEGSV